MAIPKRPLAVSKAKKTLPLTIDWGKGIPKDRLRYINAREEGLIKASRSTTAERSHAGVTSYADDSASSKGVERGPSPSRGADGPGGVGRGPATGQGGQSRGPSAGAGQGPNSPSSSSSSASSTSGGGSKSSSSSTPASSPASTSKAPNAAAQAASGRYGSKVSTNAAAASVSTSKAPNAAAAAASDRLKAMDKATAASKAQSIQSRINAQGPVSYSGQFDNGYYHSFTDNLPGQANPNQFDKTIGRTNMVNANHVPMDQFSKGYNPNKLTDGAQKIHQAIVDNSFRTGTPVDFFSGARPFNPSSPTKNHPSAQAIDIRIMDPVSGLPVGYDKIGERAYNPIGSVNPRVGRSLDKAVANQDALEGPYRDFATGVVNSFMTNPGVYGGFNNQRWGGSFGPDSWKTDVSAKDYMHFDEGKVMSNVSSDQAALRNEAMNYNPPSLGGSVGLAAAVTPQPTPLQKAMDSWNPPRPTAIPTPNGQTVASTVPQQQNFQPTPHFGPPMPPSGITSAPLGPPPQQQAPMPNARPPSQNMQAPPGWAQQAQGNPPTMSPNNPFGALGPVGNARQQSLAARIGVDDALSANPTTPVPNARPLSQNMMQPPTGPTASTALPGFTPAGLPGNFRGTAGQAYNYSSPSTYSPQAGPGDQVAGDTPQISSDNPMQGPSNPMQEGENPQIKRDRQLKYASRGATVGGLIAGHVGTVVGATLGWQMGKTPPRQRQAIASNPQALRANVQSINQMVEERGGKGNPQMQVTDAGLRDVLTNPSKVQNNPAQYTTLEQMLAALAQGVDPETGKPV